MLVRIRCIIVAMAMVGVLCGARIASAQCTQVTVTNNLTAPAGFPATINLILVDGANTVSKNCPGFGATTVINLPAGFVVRAVRGATGVDHLFPAQPPRPACAQTVPPGATACIGLPVPVPPPTVICGTVCYDDSACTITINSCPVNTCGP